MSHLPLITADQARGLLPGLSSAESQACAVFCAPASLAVERWCRTHLGFGTYLEYPRPELSRKIYLRNAHVIPGTVEIRTDLEAIARVTCTDPTATRATVGTTATTMILAIVSPTRPTPTQLTLASSTTVADLAAAINALTGWQCSVNGYGTWLVSDLEPNPGAMGALNGAAASLLAYVHDLGEWAMDRPELGEIELTESQAQAFRYPDRAYGGWGAGYGGGGYGGRGGANPRVANVRVSYQAGFDPLGVVAPMVPADVQQAVAITIRAGLDSGQFSGVIKSIELGNSKVEVNTPMAVPTAAMGFLTHYVLRRI